MRDPFKRSLETQLTPPTFTILYNSTFHSTYPVNLIVVEHSNPPDVRQENT